MNHTEKIGSYAQSHSVKDTAKKFGVAESTVRRTLRRYNASFTKEITEVKSEDNETVIRGTAETVEELLEKANVDEEIWEVYEVKIKDSQWDVTLKLSNSEYQVYRSEKAEKHTNRQFYIEVKLRRKSDIFDWHKFKKEFIADVKKHSPKVKKYTYPKLKEKFLLEINIFDLHTGKLGWHEETGRMSYDSKIAAKRFMEGIVGLVEKAKGYPIERILFPVGNDFFDSDYDYPIPVTTRGTPRQTDLRWQQVFREGRKLMIQGIDYLSAIAPIDVVVIPGNHDFQKSFYLGEVLEVNYANNPNVTVNNSPNPHKYYSYGKNLIGFTHGNTKDIPLTRLLTLMPIAVPKLWADSVFREWHLGDIHHKKVFLLKGEDDEGGVNLRYMRSLSGDDAWHNQKGYLGAIKGCEAYIWSYDWGLSANVNYNIIV